LNAFGRIAVRDSPRSNLRSGFDAGAVPA